MSGTTGNDSLTGTAGPDAINGGGGNDTIRGLGGNDTLNGDGAIPGSDGTDGNDSVLGGEGNDSILGEDGNDTLDGEAGNDTLSGGNNDDRLLGGIGLDTLFGGGGADFLDGGDDADRLQGDTGNDTVLGGAGNDTISGGTGADSILGGAGNDSIFGNNFTGTQADADTIEGGEGNDTIVAGSGSDFIRGGAGNDSILAGDGANTVAGGGGADTILGGVGNDILLGFDSASGSDTTDGADSILGGEGNDTIAGGGGNDVLNGGSGDDFITGGFGADTLVGGTNGTGGDTISYEFSPEAIAINLGSPGGQGGHAQGDSIVGFEAVVGSTFDDTLVGFSNFDNVLAGGAGNDSIVTILGDTALGGEGNDTLIGSPEFDGQSTDYLDGGAGDDFIWGRGGEDTIRGGDGDDTVRVSFRSPGDPTVSTLDGGAEGGRDVLLLDDWSGPGEIDTDTLAPGTYGNWVVSGGSGAGALRTFTHAPTGTVFRARDFEGVVCFAEGTMIATPRGEVPVERLRAGDLVLTAHAGPGLQPLLWVGRTTLDLARHPDRARVAPVRIRAGALAEGVPSRDLRVSPDHAIFLDGRLVPAGLLVNGTTIIREAWLGSVTYHHLEIQGHGLLISEGAATESYLDDGNRHLFDNAAIASLAVDFAAWRGNGVYEAKACAPVVKEGEPVLEDIRARLAARVPQHRARA